MHTRESLSEWYWRDETEAVTACLRRILLTAEQQTAADARALMLAAHVRKSGVGGIDALMQEYDLSGNEGVVLMCLAEALLRIPDVGTRNELIRERIGMTDWSQHPIHSANFLVHASTWGLMLAGNIVRTPVLTQSYVKTVWRGMADRLGLPIVRVCAEKAVQLLGRQFVMGECIESALQRAEKNRHYDYNFDMLGEAAMTDEDAKQYFDNYRCAIAAVARRAAAPGGAYGLSVKLSALHPRYEPLQSDAVHAQLYPRLLTLAQAAAAANIGLCVDAEEAFRLDLSLQLFERLCAEDDLAGWHGLGIAVQAYQKRAPLLIDYLGGLARRHRRRLSVRLVKGAYWDYEIKYAQQHGLPGYPVYTRKAHTDIAYIACAQQLLDNPAAFYPCFATHNARTLATLEQLAGQREYEFQRLLGMGESLYDKVIAESPRRCRIYAPVGDYQSLLAYLVRRLLENGANSSFIHRLAHNTIALEQVVEDPVCTMRKQQTPPTAHPDIAPPPCLYGDARRNSEGVEFGNPQTRARLSDEIKTPPPDNVAYDGGGAPRRIVAPADTTRLLATIRDADSNTVCLAVAAAQTAQKQWGGLPVAQRADVLLAAADRLRAQRAVFLSLIINEAGRTVADAVDELREAEDFLRYYAACARRLMGAEKRLRGSFGERNDWGLRARGVFLCISPWNFPLAIFIGQIAAALVTGNAVLAKPAEQTSLIAAHAVSLLHRAGVPPACLHLLCGDGGRIGAQLLAAPTGRAAIDGIAFTGSAHTAHCINRQLADTAAPAPIIPLIAETGGINAMIVDSTALPEQVARDVIDSAFRSAGQRCSSARLLCIQEEVFDEHIRMIGRAMRTLKIGDPRCLATDIGPVIDRNAEQMLNDYAEQLDARAGRLAITPLPDDLSPHGLFFAPRLYRIAAVSELNAEKFGPILHAIPYRRDDLPALCEDINALGYGLTLSVHSRVRSRIESIRAAIRVGNFYINRNQIGAVVGVQPFGGERLSGTGPKAGGPHYLTRFTAEYAVSDNITALGGDPDLLLISP